MNREVVVIAHNIRSTHNIGSILRTCDGLGVKKVYLTGYTPYPKAEKDLRLPHLADKIDKQISKTSLGAEKSVNWLHIENPIDAINGLKDEGYVILGLEQHKDSVKLDDYTPSGSIALFLGEEVNGIETALLDLCDQILEIPMHGQKESFNVSVAAAISLYQLLLRK